MDIYIYKNQIKIIRTDNALNFLQSYVSSMDVIISAIIKTIIPNIFFNTFESMNLFKLDPNNTPKLVNKIIKNNKL